MAAELPAGQRISAAGDAQVLQWLHTAAAALLAALPSSLEEDTALLEQGRAAGMDTCTQLAIQWRAGCKR